MNILKRILNIIFPAACRQCGGSVSSDAPTAYFCKICWDAIKWFDSPCRKNPLSFDEAISAGPYEGVLAEAIKLFKYKKKIHVGRALADFSPFTKGGLRGIMGIEGLQSCHIIPVPLHPSRLREREFNQSAILASVIGERLGIPLLTDVLLRERYTRPQVELDMKERKKNVVGAFTVQNEELIVDKNIILVDDVYTTGSTVNECAKVLKKNGSGKVYVVTIARMVG